MRNKKYYLSFTALLLATISIVLPSFSQSNLNEKSASKTVMLDPGASAICADDFILEAMKAKPAGVKVVLGNEDYINEKLEPGEERSYSLKGSLFLAKSHGRKVTMNDRAKIVNMSPDSKLKLRCLQLRKIPLREKDDLSIFK
jgi:hypothetical protein